MLFPEDLLSSPCDSFSILFILSGFLLCYFQCHVLLQNQFASFISGWGHVFVHSLSYWWNFLSLLWTVMFLMVLLDTVSVTFKSLVFWQYHMIYIKFYLLLDLSVMFWSVHPNLFFCVFLFFRRIFACSYSSLPVHLVWFPVLVSYFFRVLQGHINLSIE